MNDSENFKETKIENNNNTEVLDESSKEVTTVTADWKDVAKVSNLRHSKKMKKGPKIVLIILIIVAVLCGAAFGYYKFLKPDSQDVYGSIIKTYSNEVSKIMSDNIKKASKPYIESGSVSVETDMTTYKMLDKILLDYSIGIDPEAKTIVSDFSYKEDNKDILSGNIYVKDNKFYLESKQIYDKPLYISDESENVGLSEFTSKEDAKNMKYLTDKTSAYFKKAMLKAKYETKYGKVTANDKKVLVQKNYMTVDKTNINSIKNDILNSIKKDSEYIKILSNLTKTQTSEINKEIDEYLAEDLAADMSSLNIEIDTKLITNEIINIKIKTDNELTAKVNFVSKGVYEVSLYENNVPSVEGTLTITSSSINFVTTTKEYKYDISVTKIDDTVEAVLKITDKDNKQLTLSIKGNEEYNKKESKIVTDNAVDTSKLSDSEEEKISENLLKQLGSSKIFVSLLGSELE